MLLPRIKSSHAPEALDEINLFWLHHIKEIQLYLKSWFPGNKSYAFTAATYMNYSNKEYLPFLLMGDKHVLDDPLCRYAETLRNVPASANAEILYNQIGITAENNLKILEEISGDIFVLPFRLSNQSYDNGTLYQCGERVFINLFNDINSLDEYFTKCNSIEDIIQYAREDIGNLILFSEDDDFSLSIKERFRSAITGTQYMIDINKSDSYNFYCLVFGYLQQAFDVIASCVEYGCIPFITSSVSLHYIALLSNNMLEIENVAMFRYRMIVAYILYRLCDKNRLSTVCFDVFIKKKHQFHFDSKLFHSLSEHEINEYNFSNHLIAPEISDRLEEFYAYLSA